MPDLDPTPGGSTANSYVTQDEADAYFESRVPIDPPWVSGADANTALLMMATRVLDVTFAVARRQLRTAKDGTPQYYTGRAWLGAVATATQALAWPRVGMVDRLGRAIDSTTIPRELKEACCELAGQLAGGDRTLDSDIVVQGITSIRAGSVSLGFRDFGIAPQVIPDAVLNLMPPWWLTDELIEPAQPFIFEAM